MFSSLAKSFLLSAVLFMGALPTFAQPKDPGAFYGFWQTQEPAGDTWVINVKRGNRASSFFTGSGASKIIKGKWEQDGDRLILTWESGHRDVLVPLDSGTLEREAYKPGQDLSSPPDYKTRAVNVDPRVPGSLGVRRDDSAWEAQESEKEQPQEQRSSPDRVADLPIRNDFNGYWKVRQGSGGFLGIRANSAEEFYLHLQRTGNAQVSLRRWDAENTVTGKWTIEGDSAVITWPNGRRDVLRESGDGSYSMLTYQSDYEKGGKPDAVMPAARSNANEASRYFNAGDVRLFTASDIRGVWIPENSKETPERYIRIEGWGRATRHPVPADGSEQGEWKLFNDRVVITWGDGSKDVIRTGPRGWLQESFAPGVPVSGSPSESLAVTKIDSSQFNLSGR